MKVHDQVRWGPKAGATILEVLVVLSIIALIAALAGPRLIGYLGRAKTETAALQITQLRQSLQLFYIDVGRYPSDAEGLAALISAPSGEADWAGPYIVGETPTLDPWGRDYIYDAPGEGGEFVIRSLGRDGAEGGSGEDADVSG